MKPIDAISEVCRYLSERSPDAAVETLKAHYPFQPNQTWQMPRKKPHCTPLESTLVFIRDGFIDRYSGDRLIFPPVFRVISHAHPTHFPFHANWKADVTHSAYWELGATIDHLNPLSLGGAHEEANWLTTSMARNSAKQNFTLEHLGWRLHPPGNMEQWDGLLAWFFEYTNDHPAALKIASVKQWHSAGKEAALLSSELSPHVSASKSDITAILQLASDMGIPCERGFEAANSKDASELIELAIIQATRVALIINLFREFMKTRKRSISYFKEGVGWVKIKNPKDGDIKKLLSITDSFQIKNGSGI